MIIHAYKRSIQWVLKLLHKGCCRASNASRVEEARICGRGPKIGNPDSGTLNVKSQDPDSIGPPKYSTLIFGKTPTLKMPKP